MASDATSAGNAASSTGRLFIAAHLPREVRAELTGARARFEAAGAPGLRWVSAERLHLTLRFLGETRLDLTPALREAIGAAASASPALELVLARWGAFGGGRPRVLWAGLEGDVAGLQALASGLSGRLQALGIASDDRPFRPHLTLARVPERAGADAREGLAAAVRAVAPPRRLPILVEEIGLIRSHLGGGAPRYEELGRARLRETGGT